MAAYEILIADDHPLFRSALHQALTLGLGPEVRLVEAASIAELEARLSEKSDWDLVLLDLMMPEVDGFQLLEAFKRHDRADEFRPVLVLTADSTIAARRRALALGAKDFVSKPFDVIEIALRIANLLETRILYQRLRG